MSHRQVELKLLLRVEHCTHYNIH